MIQKTVSWLTVFPDTCSIMLNIFNRRLRRLKCNDDRYYPQPTVMTNTFYKHRTNPIEQEKDLFSFFSDLFKKSLLQKRLKPHNKRSIIPGSCYVRFNRLVLAISPYSWEVDLAISMELTRNGATVNFSPKMHPGA